VRAQESRCLKNQVVFQGQSLTGGVAANLKLEFAAAERFKLQRVAFVQELEQGLKLMIAIIASSENMQKEIEFRRCEPAQRELVQRAVS
jgi:hypothetical protein